MASGFTLPPPQALDMHDTNVAEKWKKFRLAWDSYALATELDKKAEKVQVATLLTIIGEEAREVFSTFAWTDEDDKAKITPVLEKYADYCQPRKNIPFERFRFNQREQEIGESYDQYKTALRKLAEGCEFSAITPDEILRDRLLFGIRDNKVRERLLREADLTLKRTDELCRASESTAAQMKEVGHGSDPVSAVNLKSRQRYNDNYKSDSNRKTTETCGNCGRAHGADSCLARGKTCNFCGKSNHFAAVCRSTRRRESRIQPAVRVIHEDEEEVYCISEIAAFHLDDTQLVTLRLESGNWIRFQPDTGAQCNVIPLEVYTQATKDFQRQKVKQSNSAISAYGGSRLPVVGQVTLTVWRDNSKWLLECKVIDSENVRPILGRKACVAMGILEYMDNDAINKQDTGIAKVFSCHDDNPKFGITRTGILKQFPDVFSEEVGQLDGQYRIKIDPTVDPVQHPPRRVPVAVRDRLKEELDKLSDQGILATVTSPTPWVNSMVAVVKPNGKMRLCLDPKDLNKAIQREHYPLPTIEEVATRLHGAKLFTKLDVRNGFWHVTLDSKSSYITTFNTPFGRYRWLRMPFGIRSAPEVFQRRMHELIEGMKNVEVIADDFVIVGYGETMEEATCDHDNTLMAFLQRCRERGLKLNIDKLKLKQTEVEFIGHVATGEGLRVDPAKVKAVREMPVPTDKAGVQRLLGLAQYLSKFLPHLSEMTKPLRELTQPDVEWCWGDTQASALEQLKEAVTDTPVLRYYKLSDEVTLQCDASQSGLGAALLQNGQPIAYASRALTPAETRYAQIEKELLAIVFACEKFDAYIYGRETVHVESDHKPLEAIMLKPLHNAPQRLQRMLLRLQKYNLDIKYKKGREMFLADALSRAFLPEFGGSEFVQALETIDHKTLLPVSQARWQQLQHAAADDPVFQELRSVILKGWPDKRADIPQCLYAYYDIRDELTVEGDLIFKGQQLVVPAAMRKELMAVTHGSHIGIESCVRRARDSLYWPRMTTELKEYIAKCDVCLAHRGTQSKEPLQPHNFVARPWSKVGADLCDQEGRTLLVVSDYYSNYIEVVQITSITSKAVIKELKKVFARFGIPDTLVTDNGPQFASAEFSVFARTWEFDHATSSPTYPQSNGKAENAVQTVKRLFKKCKAAGKSEFLALLDWRNTPTEGVGTSPSQRLMGRRCKTLLPVAGSLLQPRYNTDGEAREMAGRKQRQRFYYDKGTKKLADINPGETVRMRLPGDSKWSPGTCMETKSDRSYIVKVNNTGYRRNRRHILKTNEPEIPETDMQADTPPVPEHQPVKPPCANQPVNPPALTEEPVTTSNSSDGPRRSSRHRQAPTWQQDYVLSGNRGTSSPLTEEPVTTSNSSVGPRRSSRHRQAPTWQQDYVLSGK